VTPQHIGTAIRENFSQRPSQKKVQRRPVVVQFQGDIEWTALAITTSSDFAVKGTKTSTAAVAWLPVMSFKIDKNVLIVVTGDRETLRLHDFDVHFTGKVDRAAK
jgi:hypothetical protein